MRNHHLLLLLLVFFLPCLFRIFVLLLLHLLLGRTSGSVRSGPMAGPHRTHREFGEGETIAFGPSFTHLTPPHLTPWPCYGGHA
uniref:Putative secreted protein n=1 Tax=Anopheles darlingi TaxID=43151 RepID=A0A2M4DP74_ANODA